MLKPKQTIIANYEAIIFQNESAQRDIVLLHGYGANYLDLASLAQMIPTNLAYNWWFINAPKQLQAYPGMDCRAWFDIDQDRLLQANRSANWQTMQDSYGPQLEKVARDLEVFFIEAKLQGPRTIVGGFSQGAMVATQVVLTNDKDCLGLLVFSGAFANAKWPALMKAKYLVPVFQSHGTHDEILPFATGKSLSEEFEKANFKKYDFFTFPDGHGIPPSVLEKCSTFINNL